MKCPCIDCVDRTPTCHGECERYKEFFKWNEEVKKRRHAEQAKEALWRK